MRGFATTSVASFAIAIGLMIAGALSPRGFAGNVDARWVAPVNGEWTDPARWSTSPFYPDNGNPAESVYQVRLDVPGPDYTVTLSAPVDVGSTLITSPAATLAQAGGTFSVGNLSIRATGGAGHYQMTGGTMSVNSLDVGYNSLHGEYSVAGRFEQLSGRVDVTGGVSYVGVGPAYGPATGSLIVSGPQSRFNSVSTSSSLSNRIGEGSGGTGVAQFSNFATITLGRTYVGSLGGTGTLLIDSGAKVAVSEIIVGGYGGGNGTVILGGVPSRLSIGTGSLRIGEYDAGTGYLVVNGGTLTLPAQGYPIPSVFSVNTRGVLTVNSGAVESQRPAYVNGEFIVNGGTVSVSKFVTGAAGGSLVSGGLIINGGRVTTPEVQLYSSTYLQTGGTASIGIMTLGVNEYSSALPTARLSGGTFTVGNLNIPTGTFTYQGGLFNASFLGISGGRFVTTPGRDKTLRVGSLSISGQGRLDLGDNVMVLDSGAAPPLAAIRTLLRTGYNNGAWDGPGIISSVAQSTPTHGIGYVRPSPLFTPLLVAYTRWGDANVDGAVNLADFNALAEHFGDTDAFWFEGDFNYDGRVNLQDFNRLASNFGLSAAGPEVTPRDWARLGAAVPEPAALVAFGAAASAGMLIRRRRRG